MFLKKKTKSIIQYFKLREYWIQYVIIFFLVLVVAFLFPEGKALKYSYQLNDITREPIIAPFTFSIQKSKEKLQLDIAEQKKLVPFVFYRDDLKVKNQIDEIKEFFLFSKKIINSNWDLEESRILVYERRYHKQYEKAKAEFVSDSVSLAMYLADFYKKYAFIKDNELWNNFLFLGKDINVLKVLDQNEQKILQICRNRWTEGIYDISYNKIESEKIELNQGKVPDLIFSKNFNDLDEAWIKARKELLLVFSKNDPFRELGYDLIIEFMEPNLLFNKQLTEKRQIAEINKIPLSQGVVLKNELIVDANIRITNDVLQKLNSLSIAITKESSDSIWIKLISGFLGRFILLFVNFSLFFFFLIVYRNDLFKDWKMVFLISTIFFLQLGFAHIFVIRLDWSEYLIPFTVGAMSLTILFDVQIGFVSMISIAILIGLMMGQNIDFIIVALFTSTIAVYNSQELRNRSQLFFTMFSLIASGFIVIIGLGLFKESSWSLMFNDFQFFVISSVLAPLLTYGLIGFFETFFEVTTDLTLIELLDYDHPLLKRAQQETNGTFNHSIVVGNLAEACANAIGAHSLLCRVGAYYHDIGKMAKSEYFIENQYGGPNRHDKITHTMSAKIIRSHVNEGLRLAKEYGLPKLVSDFIPMHHGTTRVEYFYRMALKDAEKNGSKVDESFFRYPGPKPNTKETGILMLCEAIEAAVRSIKEPDIVKIESMIDKIVKSRIEDGQLSDCPLTLDELEKIKGKIDGNTGMLPVLRGIYHIRVEYPDEIKK